MTGGARALNQNLLLHQINNSTGLSIGNNNQTKQGSGIVTGYSKGTTNKRLTTGISQLHAVGGTSSSNFL
jgi:hypothetical protein